MHMWDLRQSGRKVKEIARVGTSPTGFVALVQDGEGNLYGVAHDAGAICRIQHPELKPVSISVRKPQRMGARKTESSEAEAFRADGRALEAEEEGGAIPALRKP